MLIKDMSALLLELDQYKCTNGKAYKLANVLLNSEATTHNIEEVNTILNSLKNDTKIAKPKIEVPSSEIINDSNMQKEIISDCMEHYKMNEDEARDFAITSGSRIVDSMWDEYSDQLGYLANNYLKSR